MTKSIQEGYLFGSKFVGSEISLYPLPSGHQNCEWSLKSPAKKYAYEFSFSILEYKFVKFDKKTQVCYD